MKRILLELPDSLYDAMEHARGELPRAIYLDNMLRRSRAIRRAADILEITLEERPQWGGHREKSGRPRNNPS